MVEAEVNGVRYALPEPGALDPGGPGTHRDEDALR